MDTTAFVLANTQLLPVPLVPELRLHCADEAIDLWERTEQESGHEQLAPPFWAFPWAGGQALARHVLDNPEIVAGKRVFDLAAGSGLVAIAASKAGAREVTANDIDPLSAAAITVNAGANDVRVTTEEGDVLDGDADGAEVVLAGDVFYDRHMAERVLPFVLRAAARGALVLVGDPQRAHLPRERFTVVATYDVPVPLALESTEIRRTTVWRPA
jgi:predicted nicotinamide N-methyase